MIDWTKPVETDEDQPRPVRILCLDRPHDRFPVVFLLDTGAVHSCDLDGKGNPTFQLRNAADQYEYWINLYQDGIIGIPVKTRAEADRQCSKVMRRIKCLQIVWREDGGEE